MSIEGWRTGIRGPRHAGLTYHDSGGLKSYTEPGGAETTLEEDLNGDVVSLLRPGTATRHRWTHDGLRRVTSYTQPGQVPIGYRYNVHSDPTAMLAGDEEVAVFDYNDLGKMIFASESAPGSAAGSQLSH